jgi:hypothetical protein
MIAGDELWFDVGWCWAATAFRRSVAAAVSRSQERSRQRDDPIRNTSTLMRAQTPIHASFTCPPNTRCSPNASDKLYERYERESLGQRRVVKALIKRGKQNALAGFAL